MFVPLLFGMISLFQTEYLKLGVLAISDFLLILNLEETSRKSNSCYNLAKICIILGYLWSSADRGVGKIIVETDFFQKRSMKVVFLIIFIFFGIRKLNILVSTLDNQPLDKILLFVSWSVIFICKTFTELTHCANSFWRYGFCYGFLDFLLTASWDCSGHLEGFVRNSFLYRQP